MTIYTKAKCMCDLKFTTTDTKSKPRMQGPSFMSVMSTNFKELQVEFKEWAKTIKKTLLVSRDLARFKLLQLASRWFQHKEATAVKHIASRSEEICHSLIHKHTHSHGISAHSLHHQSCWHMRSLGVRNTLPNVYINIARTHISVWK